MQDYSNEIFVLDVLVQYQADVSNYARITRLRSQWHAIAKSPCSVLM